jgi:hypothetical protein
MSAVRKKEAVEKMSLEESIDDGCIDVRSAAEKLGVSETWLKKTIPCTKNSYEKNGEKEKITGYFWSVEAIDRLVKIKANGSTDDDIKYISEELCHGDQKWAIDIASNLRPPNRTVQARKPSPEKRNEGRVMPRSGSENKRRT